jgi:hypothetical protein
VIILCLQVATNLRTAACMNAALAILGSVVAGPLRATLEVDSLPDSLFVFFYLTLVVMVEARLWFLATSVAAGKQDRIEGRGTNAQRNIQKSSVAQGQLSNRPALLNVESGGVGDILAASDAVTIELEAS